jgi:hemerythrin-like metal-binding protein
MFGKQNLLRQLALLLVLILVVGTVGYPLIEDGWSHFDGFYMTLITLTTIGFGEVHALSTAGRTLTLVIIVFGLGAAATILTQLAQLIMEGDLLSVWRKRRMAGKLAGYRDHVIICGYGRIGQAICRDLTAMGVSCVIVDRDDKRNDQARELDIPVLGGNATADQVLLDAGIERASILVAALNQDADNLFVALAARDLNPRLLVIARGEDRSVETRMLRAGVHRVVYPAQLGGGQIARLIGEELGHVDVIDPRRRVTDVMGFDLQVYRNLTPRATTVGEIQSRAGALRAVALIDAAGKRHHDPGADHAVNEGEAVVLVSEVSAAPDADDGPEGLLPLPKDLSVGIPTIDEEHRTILDMINRLDAMPTDRGGQLTREVLLDLRDYTVRHFKHEESLLLSAEFPGADAHIAEHRALTRKVESLLEEDGPLHRGSLRSLLDGWLRHHIMTVDRRYVDFLAGRTESQTVDT